MKILMMLKYQQFKDNKSNKTKSKDLKYQYLDEYDNEKKNGLDKNESKIEDIRYVFIFFISFS